MENQVVIISVMVIYVILLILWGVFQGRKVKTGNDFAIAGRKLPGWAAALSERATGESSWALLGLPGAAYAMGLTEIWTALGCVTGIITAWAMLAWRLRDEAEKYNVATFTEYLEAKHGETGKMLRVISSLAIVFFFFFYVGAQFLGGGKTLFTLFGLKPAIGGIITASIIIPYTVYGGFRSVVYTDVVQAILMIITLIVGPVVGIIYIINNPEGLYASGISEALIKSGDTFISLTGAARGFGAGLLITGGFSWFFGYLGGQPQLSVRFMAIRDSKQAKKARNIGITWTIIAYIGALMLGWIGLAMFGPAGLSDPEYVMPSVILKLFPPVLAGLLITGAIAAMISTADSLLILSATELSESILKKKGQAGSEGNSKAILKRHRLTTVMIALIALGLSYAMPSKLIFTIVSYVWAGIGCTFSVVILFSLFWKKFHGRAAILTIVSGILFTIFWISGGFEQHYKISAAKVDMLVKQQIILPDDATNLRLMEGQRFISAAKFEEIIKRKISLAGREENLPTITSAFISEGVPARLTTFIFCLVIAVLSTYFLPKSKKETKISA